jgi:plastocyanin
MNFVSRSLSSLALCLLLVAYAAAQAQTFNVTVIDKVVGDPFFNVGFNQECLHEFQITTSSVGGDLGAAALPGASGFTGNSSFSFTPTIPGTFFYQCEEHSNMGNMILILSSAESNASSSTGAFNSSTGSIGSSLSMPAVSSSSSAVPVVPPSAISFNVTVQNKSNSDPFFGQGFSQEFVLNAQPAPVLNLTRGVTYTFFVTADPSLQFFITTDSQGGQGSNDGQLSQSSGPTSNGTLTFTPDNNTPDTMFYQCVGQPFMGNMVAITPALSIGNAASSRFSQSFSALMALAVVATAASLI